MEMTALLLAIIPFFLLFSFAPKTSSSLSSAINDDPVVDINDDLFRHQPNQYPLSEPVVDDKGQVLQTGKSYYILGEDNGGLKPCWDNKICKHIAVTGDYGTALKFSSKSISGTCEQFIEPSCKLGIEFVDSGKKVWKKASKRDKNQKFYIELTPASDDPSYWFQFKKNNVKTSTYRIIYGGHNEKTLNVSYFSKGLVLREDRPLYVKFKDVKDAKEKPLNPDGPNISTEMPTVLAVA